MFNKYIYIFIQFIVLCNLILGYKAQTTTTTLYVDSNSNFILGCGLNISTACDSLVSAIESFKQINNNSISYDNQLVILMSQGQYTAEKNSQIELFGMNVIIQQAPGGQVDGEIYIDVNKTNFISVNYPMGDNTTAQTSVSISNLTVTNGDGFGGFIQVQASTSVVVSVESCILKNFNATLGGVFYTDSMEVPSGNIIVNINNSTFINNTAINGAVIFSTRGVFNIRNSVISYNTAPDCIITVSMGSLILDNIVYSNNFDTDFHISAATSIFHVSKSTFSGNTMSQKVPSERMYSVLIYYLFGKIDTNGNGGSITSSTFSGNSGMIVLQSQNSYLLVSNSIFTDNQYDYLVFQSQHGNLTLEVCTFMNNNVVDSVVYSNYSSSLDIHNSQFISTSFVNQSVNSGSNIELNSTAQVSITKTLFNQKIENTIVNCLNSTISLNNNTVIGIDYNINCQSKCNINGDDNATCYNGSNTTTTTGTTGQITTTGTVTTGTTGTVTTGTTSDNSTTTTGTVTTGTTTDNSTTTTGTVTTGTTGTTTDNSTTTTGTVTTGTTTDNSTTTGTTTTGTTGTTGTTTDTTGTTGTTSTTGTTGTTGTTTGTTGTTGTTTTTTGTNGNSDEKPKKKLSSGQITGIVIGVLAGSAFLILFVYIMYKRHHNRNKYLTIR